MSVNKIVQFTRQVAEQTVTSQMQGVFANLLRRPVETNPASPGGVGPAMGPYNQPIFYLASGVRHAAGGYINKLRPVRKYTRNAVEYRCDALGLAIYVSGLNQIKENGVVLQGARVVAYDFDRLEPTSQMVVPTSDLLLSQLHGLLLATYNRLAREYNLAGLPRDFLILRTDAAGYPPISIDMA